MKRDGDFRTFYYTKVALGEGCGCAERVIDLHEMDRTLIHRRRHRDQEGAPKRPGRLARIWLRLTGRTDRAAAENDDPGSFEVPDKPR